MNPPHKEGKLYYGSGIGVADDIRELGLAKKTADAAALEELARIVMVKFSKKITKRSSHTITPEGKKIPGGKKVEESTQEIMEVTLIGAKITKRETVKNKKGVIIIFSLAEISAENIKKSLDEFTEKKPGKKEKGDDIEKIKLELRTMIIWVANGAINRDGKSIILTRKLLLDLGIEFDKLLKKIQEKEQFALMKEFHSAKLNFLLKLDKKEPPKELYVPDWYKQPPIEPGKTFYGTASYFFKELKDLTIAREKALENARKEITPYVAALIFGILTKYSGEVKESKTVTKEYKSQIDEAAKNLVNHKTFGLRLMKQEISGWKYMGFALYVLVRLSYDAVLKTTSEIAEKEFASVRKNPDEAIKILGKFASKFSEKVLRFRDYKREAIEKENLAKARKSYSDFLDNLYKIHVSILKNELGLSDEQVKKVSGLLNKRKGLILAVNFSGKKDESLMKEWEKFRENYDAKIKKILTQIQFQFYLASELNKFDKARNKLRESDLKQAEKLHKEAIAKRDLVEIEVEVHIMLKEVAIRVAKKEFLSNFTKNEGEVIPKESAVKSFVKIRESKNNYGDHRCQVTLRKSVLIDWARKKGYVDEKKLNNILNPRVKVVTNLGSFVLELWEDKAPNTVANFIELCGKNFYNDIRFHRVIENFMIQVGCPFAKGKVTLKSGNGDAGYKFADEFVKDLNFDWKGIIAMATSGTKTNGSQIFVTVAPTKWLNQRYTIVGEVIEGMDVVEKISKVETHKKPTDNKPMSSPVKDVYIIKTEILNKRNHEYKVKKIE